MKATLIVFFKLHPFLLSRIQETFLEIQNVKCHFRGHKVTHQFLEKYSLSSVSLQMDVSSRCADDEVRKNINRKRYDKQTKLQT